MSARIRPIRQTPATRRAVGVLAATAALAAASLTACSDDSDGIADDCSPAAEFTTVASGTLTVAAVQQLPGIDINPNTKDMTGLDAVLLKDFATDNCLSLDIQPLPGPSAVASLTENKADIGGGGWYKTPERAAQLRQSETLWYDQAGIVSTTGLDSIEALKGKKVGVVGGSLFEKPLGSLLGADNVSSYQSMDQIFNDLESGRIDAALGAGATLTIQLSDRGSDELGVEVLELDPAHADLTTPGEVNYPSTKNNDALGAALDAFITDAREDGRIRDTLAEYEITSDTALEGPTK
ncbi:substrate-binding periplasmic protein [Corynebacterium glyciniphilum]|uniref:substrate-binding periplasmic protein n=1 Tax=Corynebacterium glyciniphilum TaxID=1404244 RepID=UPI003DA1B497